MRQKLSKSPRAASALRSFLQAHCTAPRESQSNAEDVRLANVTACRARASMHAYMCVCVFVCVCERGEDHIDSAHRVALVELYQRSEEWKGVKSGKGASSLPGHGVNPRGRSTKIAICTTACPTVSTNLVC